MNNPGAVKVLPKMARSFSTGSLIKQRDDFTAAKSVWDRWAKGFLFCLGVGGLSFSAVNTNYLYQSKEKGTSKVYWNTIKK